MNRREFMMRMAATSVAAAAPAAVLAKGEGSVWNTKTYKFTIYIGSGRYEAKVHQGA